MTQPSIFLLADYPGGVEIVRFLKEKGENIVGCVAPPEKVRGTINVGCFEEIVDILRLPKDRIFQADALESESGLASIQALAPDTALSLYWATMLKPTFLAISKRTINLHMSYLPYNRGANPNVWAIVEGTPAGVTLHDIDAGQDTGAIIAQKKVEVTSVDTGKTVYERSVAAAVELFKEAWPGIRSGTVRAKVQSTGGTSHLRKDYRKLDTIDLDVPTTARKVIDHLRAKTFPPFPGARFTDKDGKLVEVRIELHYVEDET